MDQSTDWQKLQRGDTVKLRTEDANLRYATIDDFSEDRMVVWVRMQELNERRLVHYNDGVSILPLSSN